MSQRTISLTGHGIGRKGGIKPYLFLLPMLVLAAAFVYYPFLKTFLYSFTSVNFKGEINGFVGLENYAYLFSRRDFSKAVVNTLRLTLINVPVTLVIAMLLALLSNRRRALSPVWETMFSLPMAVSMSAAALIFKVLLNPTAGLVNYALGLDFGWFRDRETALYGILTLTVWMGIGFPFLLFLGALRGVPSEQIDSARIDGAGPVTMFLRVQLPNISPTLLYVLCTNMVLAMMTCGPVMILTQGGPSRSTTTLIYMMYSSGYGSGNYSLAACVSILTFLMTLTFTVAAFVISRKKVHYQ